MIEKFYDLKYNSRFRKAKLEDIEKNIKALNSFLRKVREHEIRAFASRSVYSDTLYR